MAVAESGMGIVEDKVIKNHFASEYIYNAYKDEKTCGVLSEDDTFGTITIAEPIGIICGIVPTTNPTSTAIFKSLISLKTRNAIIFSPHPRAKDATNKAADIVLQAAIAAGAPKDLIGWIDQPSVELSNALMHHPDINLILATGGPGMVKAAYSSGKPAIGVGAGNTPVVIDETADIKRAVASVLMSKTFDNGTVCASEQSVILEKCCADRVREEFRARGCYFLNTEEAAKVAKLLLRPNGTINPKVVGKTAHEVAVLAGLTGVPESTPVLIARETEAGPTRPYSREKLCPILAFFIEEDEHTILKRVCEVLYGEGAGHTFAIHAQDEAVIRRFAQEVPVSRFLVNTPASLGGIGASTNLFPALTLGCGAVGGSSSSNNIGPLDLINLRRVAWGVREIGKSGQTKPDAPLDPALIDALTEQILKKLL